MVGITLKGDCDEGEEKLMLAKFIRDSPQIKVMYLTAHMSFDSSAKEPQIMMEFAKIVN